MKKIIRNQKGATLLELIVSLSIVLMLTIGVSGMIFNAINYQVLTEKKRNATNLGQMILEELATVEEVKIRDLVEFELPSLDNLKKSDSIRAIEGTYEQKYGSYKATLLLEKALTLGGEVSNASNILFTLEGSKLSIEGDDENKYSVTNEIAITKNQDNQYIATTGTLSQQGDEATITINILDNIFEGRLQIESNLSEWVTVDVRYVQDNFDKLKIDNIGKIHVRHIYNEQDSEDVLEDFYHFTLTISLNGQELFKTYGNQFLKVREGESGEEKKEGF